MEQELKKKSRKFSGLIIVFSALFLAFVLSFFISLAPELLSTFSKSIVYAFSGFIVANAGITGAVVMAHQKPSETIKWGNKFTGLLVVILVLFVAMIVFRYASTMEAIKLFENQADYYTSISKWVVFGYLSYVGGNGGITIASMISEIRNQGKVVEQPLSSYDKQGQKLMGGEEHEL